MFRKLIPFLLLIGCAFKEPVSPQSASSPVSVSRNSLLNYGGEKIDFVDISTSNSSVLVVGEDNDGKNRVFSFQSTEVASTNEKSGFASFLIRSAAQQIQTNYQAPWKVQEVWNNTFRIKDFNLKQQLKESYGLLNFLSKGGSVDLSKTALNVNLDLDGEVDSEFIKSISGIKIGLYYEDAAKNLVRLSQTMATDEKGENISFPEFRGGELKLKFEVADQDGFVEIIKNNRTLFARADNLLLTGTDGSTLTRDDFLKTKLSRSARVFVMNDRIEQFLLPDGSLLTDFLNQKLGGITFGASNEDIDRVGDIKSTIPFGKRVTDFANIKSDAGRWVFLSPDSSAIDAKLSAGKTYALVYVTAEKLISSMKKEIYFSKNDVTHSNSEGSLTPIGKLNSGDVVKLSFSGSQSFYEYSTQDYSNQRRVCNTDSDRCWYRTCRYTMGSASMTTIPMPLMSDLDEYRIYLQVGSKKFPLSDSIFHEEADGSSLKDFVGVINVDGLPRIDGGHESFIVVDARPSGNYTIGKIKEEGCNSEKGNNNTSTVPAQKFHTFNIKANITKFGAE